MHYVASHPPGHELTAENLAELNGAFEIASAVTVIKWAVDRFHPHLCLTASMTDAVLIDLATSVEPSIEVVFIDTGFHFPDTIDTMNEVRRRYGLNLRILTSPPCQVPLWQSDPDRCCKESKVSQLDRALTGKAAWMSGLRRAESPTRRGTPIVARDKRGLVKINPLANWDDHDVETYIADHEVPVNPLLKRGYPSIGCWPCTSAVNPGEDNRSGRWPGQNKLECGMHD